MYLDNQGGFFFFFGVDLEFEGVNVDYFMIYVDMNGEVLVIYNYGIFMIDIFKFVLVYVDGILIMGGFQSNIFSVF